MSKQSGRRYRHEVVHRHDADLSSTSATPLTAADKQSPLIGPTAANADDPSLQKGDVR